MSSATHPGDNSRSDSSSSQEIPNDIARQLQQMHQAALSFDQKMRESHDANEIIKSEQLQKILDDRSILPGIEGDTRGYMISKMYENLVPMTYEQSAMLSKQNIDKALEKGSGRLREEIRDPSRPKMSMEEAMAQMVQASREYADLCRTQESARDPEPPTTSTREDDPESARPETVTPSTLAATAADGSRTAPSNTKHSERRSETPARRTQSWPSFKNATPATNPSSSSIRVTNLSKSSPNIHNMGQ